ncbi:MAG: phosphoribosylaminoimidazolesuccinocarboxamide synthase [Proteobacteria bacterium]|nr:phosphoribosylaminoimidazolesuccinocarboxamide synthase [Pseudomonadota bacterium]
MRATTSTDSCRDLQRLAEGKTKIIYADRRDDGVVLVRTKDDITAGDGARHDVLAGKAALATATTCNVFHLLNEAGLDTHFQHKIDSVTFRAHRAAMVPIEVVVRRIATGSFLRRNPSVAEGTRFRPPLIEYFEKNDALHDPQIDEDQILRRGLLDAGDMARVKQEALRAFEVLERAWALRDVVLVDFKVEFGRATDGRLLLADVIDNDSWRIWPGGQKEAMKDKQVYRNLQERTPEALSAVLDNYRWVSEKTESFMNTRMGHAVLFRPHQSISHPREEEAWLVHTLFRELHYLGIECTSVQGEDVPAAARSYDADGRPLVGFVIGSHVPWLQESVAFPIVYVEAPQPHDRSVEDACRRAAWQGARVLSVQDPALYGRLLSACRA